MAKCTAIALVFLEIRFGFVVPQQAETLSGDTDYFPNDSQNENGRLEGANERPFYEMLVYVPNFNLNS